MNISDRINAKNTAKEIPALVRSKIPKASPNGPRLLTESIAPWINKWPNDVIGIRAPAPAYNTILS